MNNVTIIAEAGVNHNGDIVMAKKLIKVAAEAGCDYVKFQTFIAKNVVSRTATKADYQKINTGNDSTQIEMLEKLQLSFEQHYELIESCKENKIKFFSTAFDIESIDFLKSLNLGIWKIPSGEITNLPFLKKIGSFNEKVILSTGMSSMTEIFEALDILLRFGTSRQNITILHCNTDYPTAFEDVNLKAMNQIKNQFGVHVGYSDHTLGIEVPIAAVTLGAVLIEKHFTLDRNLDGPDHRASLEPTELNHMVSAIRNISKALGSGNKQPSNSELKNKDIARKSIHISRPLPEGHILSESDIIMKRPGYGISPMKMEMVIGKKLKISLDTDHMLKFEDII